MSNPVRRSESISQFRMQNRLANEAAAHEKQSHTSNVTMGGTPTLGSGQQQQQQQQSADFSSRTGGGGGGAASGSGAPSAGSQAIHRPSVASSRAAAATTNPQDKKQAATAALHSANLSYEDNVIARLDGLYRLMNENNTMLTALMHRLIKAAAAGQHEVDPIADLGGPGKNPPPRKSIAGRHQLRPVAAAAAAGGGGGDAASGTASSPAANVDMNASLSFNSRSRRGHSLVSMGGPASPGGGGSPAGGPDGHTGWSKAKQALLRKVRQQRGEASLSGSGGGDTTADDAAVAAAGHVDGAEIINSSFSPTTTTTSSSSRLDRNSKPPSLRGEQLTQDKKETSVRRREGAVVSISEPADDDNAAAASAAARGSGKQEGEESNNAMMLSVTQPTGVYKHESSGEQQLEQQDGDGGDAEANKINNTTTTSMIEQSSSSGMQESDNAAVSAAHSMNESSNNVSPSENGNGAKKQRQVVRNTDMHHQHDDEEDGCCCGLWTYTIDPESWLAFALDLIFIFSGFAIIIMVITFLLLPAEDRTMLEFEAAVAVTGVCQFFTALWVLSRFMMQSRGRADENPFVETNPESEWDVIDDAKECRAKYLAFYFWFDLLFAFPIEFAFVFDRQLFFLVMLRHVLRFHRISTVGRSANPLQESSQSTGMVLCAYGCVILLILDFFATLFVRFENEYNVDPNNAAILDPTRVNFTLADGIYWSVATLSSVGYGDLKIYSQSTRILAIVGCCAGIVVVATAAGVATKALTERDILEEEISRSKKMMHSMLRHFSIPRHLTKEIIGLFPTVLKAQSESTFREMIRVLPSFVSDQVEAYLRAKMLAKVPLFQDLGDASEEILLKLSRSLEQVFAAPYEMIIRAGEAGAEMFLLVHGVTEVLLPVNDTEEVPVATLRSGSYFGEIALLSEESGLRTASVQAVTACDLLVLGRDEFVEVVKEFPELDMRVKQEISKRREELKKKQRASTADHSGRRKSSIGRDALRAKNADLFGSDEEDDDEEETEEDTDSGTAEDEDHHHHHHHHHHHSPPPPPPAASDLLFKSVLKAREQQKSESPASTNIAPAAGGNAASEAASGRNNNNSGGSGRPNPVPARKPLNRSSSSSSSGNKNTHAATLDEQHPAGGLPPTGDDIFEEDLGTVGNPLSGPQQRRTSVSLVGDDQMPPIVLSRPASTDSLVEQGNNYNNSNNNGSGLGSGTTPPTLSLPKNGASAAAASSSGSGGLASGSSFRRRSGSTIDTNNNSGSLGGQHPPQQSALGLLSGGAGGFGQHGGAAGGVGGAGGGGGGYLDQIRSRGATPMPGGATNPNQRPLSPFRPPPPGSGFG